MTYMGITVIGPLAKAGKLCMIDDHQSGIKVIYELETPGQNAARYVGRRDTGSQRKEDHVTLTCKGWVQFGPETVSRLPSQLGPADIHRKQLRE